MLRSDQRGELDRSSWSIAASRRSIRSTANCEPGCMWIETGRAIARQDSDAGRHGAFPGPAQAFRSASRTSLMSRECRHVPDHVEQHAAPATPRLSRMVELREPSFSARLLRRNLPASIQRRHVTRGIQIARREDQAVAARWPWPKACVWRRSARRPADQSFGRRPTAALRASSQRSAPGAWMGSSRSVSIWITWERLAASAADIWHIWQAVCGGGHDSSHGLRAASLAPTLLMPSGSFRTSWKRSCDRSLSRR